MLIFARNVAFYFSTDYSTIEQKADNNEKSIKQEDSQIMTNIQWQNHNFTIIGEVPKQYLGLQIIHSLSIDGKEVIPPKPNWRKFIEVNKVKYKLNGQEINIELISHISWGTPTRKCTLKIDNNIIYNDRIPVKGWIYTWLLGVPVGFIIGLIICFVIDIVMRLFNI